MKLILIIAVLILAAACASRTDPPPSERFDTINEYAQELLAYTPGTPVPGGVTQNPCPLQDSESFVALIMFTP